MGRALHGRLDHDSEAALAVLRAELSGTPTRVMTDQLRALDAQAITGSVGRLSTEELLALDEALALVLGLRS